jgi:hypothetical protein
MPQWLQDLLVGIVGGSISGIIAAIAIAVGAAGIATGVWNPKRQLDRIRDLVPKTEFNKRWGTWSTYVSNVNSRGSDNNTPFHQLVREINTEFVSSYPHPSFPPGSMSEGFAALPLGGVPLLTRNAIVRGAIDKVRSRMSENTKYPPTHMAELLTFLYSLLN